jgi:hypothetical protein
MHRTEVTEVTKGGLRLDGERVFGGQLGFLGEKDAHWGDASLARRQ